MGLTTAYQFHFAALMSLTLDEPEFMRLLDLQAILDTTTNTRVEKDVLKVTAALESNPRYNNPKLQALAHKRQEFLHKLVPIWKLNSFRIDDFGDKLAIFPTVSLIAHSCKPSCYVELNKKGDRIEVKRLGGILTAGQEITIDYLNGKGAQLQAVERRAKLKAQWFFDCVCKECRPEM